MIQNLQNLVFGNRNVGQFHMPFIIVIDTRNTISGGSANNEFKFPVNTDIPDSYINFLVDYGDGNFRRLQSKAEALVPYQYATPGIYELKFYLLRSSGTAQIPFRYESYPAERNKILKIKSLGRSIAARAAYASCPNLSFSELQDEAINIGAESMYSNLPSLTTFGRCKKLSTSATVTSLLAVSVNFNQPSLELDISSNSAYFGALRQCESLQSLRFLYVRQQVGLNLNNMFQNCHAWNADFTTMTDINWSRVTAISNFMTKTVGHPKYVAYNPIYYDNLLAALDAGGVTGLTLHFTSKYTSAGAAHRSNLLAKGWTITDLGLI